MPSDFLSALRCARRPVPAAVALFALATLVACGGGADGAGTTTSAAVGPMPRPAKVAVKPGPSAPEAPGAPAFEPLTLVPADTVAVVRVASLDALEEAVLKVGALADLGGTHAPLRERMMLLFAQAGVEWSALRSDEPVVLALRLPLGAQEPELVAFAPVSTARQSGDTWTNQTEVDGDYLAITMAGVAPPEAAPPRWCDDLGTGLLRVRVDVKTLVARLGPILPIALAGALPSQEPASELDAEIARQRRELLAIAAAARELDLSLDLVDGRLAVATQLDVEGGPIAESASKCGNPLSALSRHLTADVPIAGALAFDVDNPAQLGAGEVAATLTLLPEPMRAACVSLHAAVMEFLRAFEPGMVVMVDPTPGSMHLACVLQAENPLAAREALGDLIGACDLEALGFELSLPVRSRHGNTVVEAFTFRFDSRRLDFDARSQMRATFESFLGSPNLTVFVGTSGREMMLVLGGESLATQAKLRAFSEPKGAPTELQTGLAALGSANPAALWRIDAGRLVTIGAECAAASSGASAEGARREALRNVPGLGSVPLVMWGGTRADRAFGGLEVDLGDLERAFGVLKGR